MEHLIINTLLEKKKMQHPQGQVHCGVLQIGVAGSLSL